MSDQTARVPTPAEQAHAVPSNVPALPLRDTVLFPNSFMPLPVARASSVQLADDAIAAGRLIGVFTQRDPADDEPGQEQLYPVGTLTHVHKLFKLPVGSLRLIARGYSYREVAGELFISVKTVETHMSSVLRKLQLSSRHELTRWASDRRLL